MSKTLRAVAAAVCLVGCEHVDSLDASTVPDPDPGMSSSIEAPTLSAELVDRVEPPPPPTRAELRISKMKNWFSLLSMEAQQAVSQVCTYRIENPCGVMLTGGVDPQPGMLASLDEQEQPQAYNYCDVVRRGPVCDTPLVIAFESEPIAFANHLPTASTPWLALDRDGDGAITSRGELFGDATVLPDGTIAKNGFLALAPLDTNRDGVIDRHDPAFASLLLWADRNGDRTSSPSELRPASDIVLSIPLANHRDVRCTAFDDCEGERGTVHWRAADGSERQGAVVDVYISSERTP